MSPDNNRRADLAQAAIDGFQNAMTGPSDDCDVLADLLGDLLHLCDRRGNKNGWCFDAELWRARRHFGEEKAEARGDRPRKKSKPAPRAR